MRGPDYGHERVLAQMAARPKKKARRRGRRKKRRGHRGLGGRRRLLEVDRYAQ